MRSGPFQKIGQFMTLYPSIVFWESPARQCQMSHNCFIRMYSFGYLLVKTSFVSLCNKTGIGVPQTRCLEIHQ